MTPKKASLGVPFNYTVSVANLGTVPANNVTLSVETNSALGLVSGSFVPGQGTCSGLTGVCRLGTIAAGSTVTVTMRTTGIAVGTGETVLTSTQTEGETNIKNNGAVVTTTVIP